MIIVEGPDGSGKTTLIKQLVQLTGLEVAPRVVSKDAEAMVDLKQWVEENVEGGFQDTIFDRHRLISEPIYGPILRKEFEPGFDDPQWFYYHLQTLYKLEPIIIYCLPPFEVVWGNILAEEDNRIFHGNPTAVRSIWGAYFNKAMTEHALNRTTWVYDYTEERFADHLVSLISKTILKKVNPSNV